MKIIVNGIEVLVGFCKVDIDLNKMTRQFNIANTEDSPSFKEGDVVEVYSNLGRLRIKAEVELVSCGGENKTDKDYEFVGRNDAKYIVDCYADKTIQFSERQTVQSVLVEIAGNFGLKVIGNAEMPKDTIYTILIGTKFGKAFMQIAENSGQIITSDAEGNIVIEPESQIGQESFTYGENIRNRKFKNNTTDEYDRYVFVSQSNYLIDQDQDVDVEGEYGSGKFVKVKVSKDNLNIDECEKLAEIEYWKDRRKSFVYRVEVDTNVDIDVSTLYLVTDIDANVSQMMNCKRIVETMSNKTDKIVATFENKQGK